MNPIVGARTRLDLKIGRVDHVSGFLIDKAPANFRTRLTVDEGRLRQSGIQSGRSTHAMMTATHTPSRLSTLARANISSSVTSISIPS